MLSSPRLTAEFRLEFFGDERAEGEEAEKTEAPFPLTGKGEELVVVGRAFRKLLFLAETKMEEEVEERTGATACCDPVVFKMVIREVIFEFCSVFGLLLIRTEASSGSFVPAVSADMGSSNWCTCCGRLKLLLLLLQLGMTRGSRVLEHEEEESTGEEEEEESTDGLVPQQLPLVVDANTAGDCAEEFESWDGGGGGGSGSTGAPDNKVEDANKDGEELLQLLLLLLLVVTTVARLLSLLDAGSEAVADSAAAVVVVVDVGPL